MSPPGAGFRAGWARIPGWVPGGLSARSTLAQRLGQRLVADLAARDPLGQALLIHQPPPPRVVVVHGEQRLAPAGTQLLVEVGQGSEVAVAVRGRGPQ